jgi:hypothetical protein
LTERCVWKSCGRPDRYTSATKKVEISPIGLCGITQHSSLTVLAGNFHVEIASRILD